MGCWLLLWAVVFHDALLSVVDVWLANDTFNHCFLVVPGVLYAVWQQRGAVLARAPGYSWLGALGVAAVIFVYALGQAAYVELLQHLAIFGMLPAMALFLFGWRVVLAIWAPLAFTLFSVPVGEELIPAFQDVTADMAVMMLKMIGIPVYRDGLYISVSNGNFVVAEACSGVRFFIASVVIGCAYAYLNFIAWWRALAFVVFSVVLPVVANGIRAFGIIYIGHATEMEHAAGADHLIYGWFFFAVVIVFLILIGHWFSDGHRQWQNQVTHVDAGWNQRNTRLLVAAALLPLLLAVGIKALVNQQQSLDFNIEKGGLEGLPAEQANQLDWTPRFADADIYRVGSDPVYGVSFYQAIYFNSEPGREMLKWSQRTFDIEAWSLKGQYTQDVPQLGTVMVSHVTSLSGRQRLLAHWFVVPGLISSSTAMVKLQQAINTLFLRPSGGALVAVSLEFDGPLEQARDRLAQVLLEHAVDMSQPVIKRK